MNNNQTQIELPLKIKRGIFFKYLAYLMVFTFLYMASALVFLDLSEVHKSLSSLIPILFTTAILFGLTIYFIGKKVQPATIEITAQSIVLKPSSILGMRFCQAATYSIDSFSTIEVIGRTFKTGLANRLIKLQNEIPNKDVVFHVPRTFEIQNFALQLGSLLNLPMNKNA